jgi:hypothetical protein
MNDEETNQKVLRKCMQCATGDLHKFCPIEVDVGKRSCRHRPGDFYFSIMNL